MTLGVELKEIFDFEVLIGLSAGSIAGDDSPEREDLEGGPEAWREGSLELTSDEEQRASRSSQDTTEELEV